MCRPGNSYLKGRGSSGANPDGFVNSFVKTSLVYASPVPHLSETIKQSTKSAEPFRVPEGSAPDTHLAQQVSSRVGLLR